MPADERGHRCHQDSYDRHRRAAFDPPRHLGGRQVKRLGDLNPTVPPVVLVPPPRADPQPPREASPGPTITPISFSPGRVDEGPSGDLRRRASRGLVWALVVAAALLVACCVSAAAQGAGLGSGPVLNARPNDDVIVYQHEIDHR